MAAEDIIASDLEIAFTEAAIEANRKTLHKLQPRQKCYNCDADLEGDQLFCNTDCSEEWEWYAKRSKVQTYEGAL